jgi:hypothetical protein
MDAVPARAQTVAMTFTLLRFHRPSLAASAPVQPSPVQPSPVQPSPVQLSPVQLSAAATLDAAADLTDADLRDVYLEVVLPGGQALLRVPGWQLRLWPTASLGDATLEAHPENLQSSVASLTDVLHAQGIQTLGLTRRQARR